MFKEVFGHTFVELVEKLINTVDKKEENQIIIDDIKNNRSKIFKEHSLDKNINKQAGNNNNNNNNNNLI